MSKNNLNISEITENTTREEYERLRIRHLRTSGTVAELMPPDDAFLLVDAFREWGEWRGDYERQWLVNIKNYLPFMNDARALSEQIEAINRGLA